MLASHVQSRNWPRFAPARLWQGTLLLAQMPRRLRGLATATDIAGARRRQTFCLAARAGERAQAAETRSGDRAGATVSNFVLIVGEDAMTRSCYELALGAKVIEAARTAVAEQLPGYLPAMQEPPPEISELIARLVALEEQRTTERRVVASLPFQVPLPGATPPRG
jgi:hypothetical protein